jgi:pimeloyl-ACP methyl ester carboxylesterase
MGGLFVKHAGRGPRVMLLHGGVLAGELCWRQQLPLAGRFRLEIVDRAGYGRSQRVSPGEDLDTDAPLVAGLLAGGAHLVGHSSGAVAAMLAASLRPQAVLSLTLCEPPAFQLAPGSAEAQQMARDLEEQLRRSGSDAEWLRGFLAIIGRSLVIPDQLPAPLAQGVRAIRAIRRRPWEGDLPIDQLAAAPFPKLVISGKHSPAFEAVCDALALRLQAQRDHITGAGHATPETGDTFNQPLGAFIRGLPLLPSLTPEQHQPRLDAHAGSPPAGSADQSSTKPAGTQCNPGPDAKQHGPDRRPGKRLDQDPC